jgi:hypothetical protein
LHPDSEHGRETPDPACTATQQCLLEAKTSAQEVRVRLKPFIIIACICGAIGFAAFVAAFGITNGLVTVSDDFFTEIAEGDYQTAYGYLSCEFHDNTTVDELQTFAQESALAEYAEATWWQRTVSGDEGLLDGQVETTDGQELPITIWFLKEDGAWKIYQIDW